MSTNSHPETNHDPAADPAAALFSFWSQWMEQSARGTQAMLEAVQSAGDLQHLQRNWLDPIAQSIEEFMRTPVFLEAMKRNFKATTDLKRLQDQIYRDGARHAGRPTAADVTGLFDRLHSTEQAIIARLAEIEGRLKAIEEKIGPAAGHRRASGRAADEGAAN